MSSRSRIVIIAGSVAVLGWGYSHIRDDQARSRREIDRLNTALAQVQRHGGAAAAGAEGERYAIGRAAEVAREAARETAREEAGAALAEQAGADGARARGAPRVTFEESQERVRSAFAAESIDASWGPDAERTLERIVRSHLPSGSRLDKLACRSSMCEVQLTLGDPGAQGTFLRTGFQGWPGSLFVAGEKQDGGAATVTIIAAREGTEPPMAPR
jgi:hypothetical protein